MSVNEKELFTQEKTDSAETAATEEKESLASAEANADTVEEVGVEVGAETENGGEPPEENLEAEKEEKADEGKSKKEAFAELSKKKAKITDFTALLRVDAKYSTAEALDLLINTLKTKYRYLDEAFLGLAEGKAAFRTETLFAPVYRMKAQANFYWKKGKGAAALEHSSQVSVSEISSPAPAYLNATDFAAQSALGTETKIEEDRLTSGKKPSVKDCVKTLKEKAAQAAPDKKADCVFSGESYELLYVPVLKAELTFGEKVYTQWVNLVNGVCKTEYAVAEVAVLAAEKTMVKVAKRKRSIFSCLLYMLTFLVLNILHWQIGKGKGLVGAISGSALTLILGGIALLGVLALGGCFAYNKQKLIDRAVTKGKLASAKTAAALNFAAILLALASVVLFTIFVLL